MVVGVLLVMRIGLFSCRVPSLGDFFLFYLVFLVCACVLGTNGDFPFPSASQMELHVS